MLVDLVMEDIMSEWQPIETAPRDGAEILICWKKQFGGWFVTAAYLNEGRCFAVGGGLLGQPTHWMPLPAPPPHTLIRTEDDIPDRSLEA
jgi:hypothetical protein